MSALVIAFGPRLRYQLLSSLPSSDVRLGGISYRALELGDWTGFYDWLRRRDGVVIGVRYWPFEDGRELLASVPKSPVVVVEPGKSVSVRFGTGEVEESLSDDQQFGGNQILASDEGDWAVTFDAAAVILEPGSWVDAIEPG